MSAPRKLAAAIGATAAMVGMSVSAIGPSAGASPRVAQLRGTAAPWTAHSRVLGSAATSQKLTVEFWLRPDTAAATRFANAVSTPGTSSYGHYVSPDAYTRRFAASQAQANKVAAWLRSKHFSAVSTAAGRSYVSGTASVKVIDRALDTQVDNYASSKAVNAGRYALRANNRNVSIPTSLGSSILGVTGLDNAAPVMNLKRVDHVSPTGTTIPPGRCSRWYGQHRAGPLPKKFGIKRFATDVCGYRAKQIRAAYGANRTNEGAGARIALVELGLAPKMFNTLTDYAKANGIPRPSAGRYAELSLGRGTACGDEFAVEEQLDVESSYDMALKAKQLVVGGDSCNNGDFGLQGLFNADEAILQGDGGHPAATIASNSWEGYGEIQPTSLINIEHSYLLRAAAEGVGMYFSAGDGPGVETPSSDPYATAVGGTTLGIGKHKNRMFETGWSTGINLLQGNSWLFVGGNGASGGGQSLLWREPRYQKGVVPHSIAKAPGNRGMSRAVPDISADADPFTGFDVGIITTNKGVSTYSESDIGGTSLASPLVAGIVAATQGRHRALGFINPLIYKLAGTSAIHATTPLTSKSRPLYRGVFCPESACGAPLLTTNEDQNREITLQTTRNGYDTMTGIGTPNGQTFINALRRLAG